MYPHTVLCIDDEPHILAALRRTFMDLPQEVRLLTETSGRDGLTVLAENSVSLIICDQRMPGMSGTEFLSRARVIAPNALRILLTGYIEARTLEEAVNLGEIFRFISKPWDNEELLRATREALSIYERNVFGARASAPAGEGAPGGAGEPAAEGRPAQATRSGRPRTSPGQRPSSGTHRGGGAASRAAGALAARSAEAGASGGGEGGDELPVTLPNVVRPGHGTGPTVPTVADAYDVATRQLVEALPVALFGIDGRGTVRVANAAARRVCDSARLPVVGSHFTAVLPPEVRGLVETHFTTLQPAMLGEVTARGERFQLQLHPVSAGPQAGSVAVLLMPQARMPTTGATAYLAAGSGQSESVQP